MKKRTTATMMMIAALTAITRGTSLIAWEADGFDENPRALDANDANRGSLRNELALRQHVDATPVDRGDAGGTKIRRGRAGAPVQVRMIGARHVIRPLRRAQR